MTPSPDSESDSEFLALVADILNEQPPLEALRLALAAPVLVGAHDALADQDYDSLLEDEAILLRSSADNQRSASFTRDDITVDFEILDDGRTLVGQVMPAAPARVELVQLADRRSVDTDRFGTFRVLVGAGPLQLRVQAGTDGLSTPWLTR